VRLVRAACVRRYEVALLADLVYILVFVGVFGTLAVKRLRRRLVS
jgi:hypothetical protein